MIVSYVVTTLLITVVGTLSRDLPSAISIIFHLEWNLYATPIHLIVLVLFIKISHLLPIISYLTGILYSVHYIHDASHSSYVF